MQQGTWQKKGTDTKIEQNLLVRVDSSSFSSTIVSNTDSTCDMVNVSCCQGLQLFLQKQWY